MRRKRRQRFFFLKNPQLYLAPLFPPSRPSRGVQGLRLEMQVGGARESESTWWKEPSFYCQKTGETAPDGEPVCQGFPSGSDGKESPCNLGSIPGSEDPLK